MSRTVLCQVFKEELPGLEFQPYPGELGKRIFENISARAWQEWLRHQTMLINEHRLTPIDPQHRKFLDTEMENYFFGEGSEKPEGFVPESGD